MSTRELIFLGTSSQVPTRTRNHNAMFLLWDKLGILFDPGEGTQRQLLFAGISASRITHIALTHFHGDHCLGLPGIIQRLSLDNVKHPVPVIFPRSGQAYFERLRNASVFYDAAEITPVPLEQARNHGGMFEVARYDTCAIYAHRLEHSTECFGYRLQEDAGRTMMPELLERHGVRGPRVRELISAGKLQIDGRTVTLGDVSRERPGQSFALVMDTRPCAGATILSRDADLLVCESTYLESESIEAHDHFHMTTRDAANLAKNGGVRRLALTHFSPRYTSSHEFFEQASAVFPDVVVADDLTRVAVPHRRGLESDTPQSASH